MRPLLALSVIGIVLIAGCASSQSSNGGLTESPTEKVNTEKTFGDVEKLFNSLYAYDSGYTELQKQETYDKEIDGKYVQWSGELVDIKTESGGVVEIDYETTIRVESGAIALAIDDQVTTVSAGAIDVVVLLKKDQRERALGLQKGSEVTYAGKIDKVATYSGPYLHQVWLIDGEIKS